MSDVERMLWSVAEGYCQAGFGMAGASQPWPGSGLELDSVDNR